MRDILNTHIEAALAKLGITDVAFSVEHPDDVTHGDYATNAAMAGAKKAGKNPRVLAEEIAAALREAKIPFVADITIASPGFVNFTLAQGFFVERLKHILEAKEQWGHSDLYHGETILIEYTSPNLFKPLHVGNLVGNIIGESLARLFAAGGADVKRLNYPSDIGLAVAKAVWGLKTTQSSPEDINALGLAYRLGNEAYEGGGAEKEAIEEINRTLYKGTDPELSDLRSRGITTSRERLAELCRMLGTEFDAEIFESEAGPVGCEVVAAHTTDGIFEESEGAVIYRGEKVGLHTRVFLNSQGLPTYEAKDLGNFALKQKRYPEWAQLFVVTGVEQQEYFKVLIAVLREVFPETAHKILEHIPTGFLTLTTGKMSSRKGNVLTGESLLSDMRDRARDRARETRAEDVEMLTEVIAVAALKYQILRQSVGSNIVFDKDRALSFEGASGPYLQYTAARAHSILRKAVERGITAGVEHPPESAFLIERLLHRFPDVVAHATTTRSPHHLVVFLTDVASAFNSFYAQERITDADVPHTSYKVALTEAILHTLANGLWLLGIKVPARM